LNQTACESRTHVQGAYDAACGVSVTSYSGSSCSVRSGSSGGTDEAQEPRPVQRFARHTHLVQHEDVGVRYWAQG
jgi:hypothetical protein